MPLKCLWLTVLLFLFTAANASFTPGKQRTAPIASATLPTLQQVENIAGRKLTLKEKIAWWLTKRKIKKEMLRQSSQPPADSAGEAVKANNQAKLSFIFALLSFVTPLTLIPAFILKGAANDHKELLTPTSKNQLKAVKWIGILWIVATIVALVILFLYLALFLSAARGG